MNVLVPVNNFEHIDDYISSGATEFYMGFHDNKWQEKFGPYADINRLTGYRSDANPFSFQELLEVIPEIQKEVERSILPSIPVCIPENSWNIWKGTWIR